MTRIQTPRSRSFLLVPLCVTIIVLLATSPVGAAELKGIVLKNQLGGPPVANVAITSIGANPSRTHDDGQFRLDFPDKSPGDTIRVVIDHKGYVVVNDIELEQVLRRDPANRPLLIFICTPSDREEMARRYYRLKSLEAIKRSYESRLKGIQSSNTKQPEQLQHEIDRAIRSANRLAEELALNKPNDNTVLAKRQMLLILDGEIKKAMERDPETLLMMGSTSENNLGDAYHDVGRPDDARINYEQARRHREELVKKYSRVYLPDLAQTLFNLGVLNRDEGHMDEAHSAYQESLHIRRSLADGNPGVYLPYVAVTLGKLGDLYCQEGRKDEARQAYQESLNIYGELATRSRAEEYPREFEVDFSSLNSLLEKLTKSSFGCAVL